MLYKQIVAPTQFGNALQKELADTKKELVAKCRELEFIRQRQDSLNSPICDANGKRKLPSEPVLTNCRSIPSDFQISLRPVMKRRSGEELKGNTAEDAGKEAKQTIDSRTRNTEKPQGQCEDSEESEDSFDSPKELKSKLVRTAHAFFLLKSQNQELLLQNERLIDSCHAQSQAMKSLESAVKSYRERLKDYAIERAIYGSLLGGKPSRTDPLRAMIKQPGNSGLNHQSLTDIKDFFQRSKARLEQTALNRIRESVKLMDVEVDNSAIDKMDVALLSRSKSAHPHDATRFSFDIDLSPVGPAFVFEWNRRSSCEKRTLKSYDLGDLL